jgi:(p)ppGpp synthase/HD superfamily hydrolase
MWSPRIQKAIEVAASAHRKQLRKGKDTPYIVHPVAVAAMLAAAGADENTIIAGYLHDIIEDVPHRYSRADMLRDFGEQVVDIVDGVTEDKSIKDWRRRKQSYLDQMINDNRESLLVSAADMASNMSDMEVMTDRLGEDLDGYFTSTPDQRLWFYGKRMEILREKLGDHPVMKILEEQWQTAEGALRQLIA